MVKANGGGWRLGVAVVAAGAAMAWGCSSSKRSFGGVDTFADAAPETSGQPASGSDAGDSQGTNTSATTDGETATDLSVELGTSAAEGDSSTSNVEGPDSGYTDVSTGSSGETSAAPDFGVGEPPQFGDFGPGAGKLLVVNALTRLSEPVDVWLAGAQAPALRALSLEAAASLDGDSGGRRVVFTQSGTLDVVGCSSWFPLRAGEQWAVVASEGAHDCSGAGDGSTLTFRQERPLEGNPVRYVHATTPDSFAWTRDDQAEAGVLAPGATLKGTTLPSCRSGCEVRYALAVEGGRQSRYFTLRVSAVDELPVAGEVMLLVLGDVRQDWPAAPDSLRLLRVDADGKTYTLRRDPELAFARMGEGGAVFNIVTPPTVSELLAVDPCEELSCALQTLRWRAGEQTFYVETKQGNSEVRVELATGRRYVLLSTDFNESSVFLLEADFERSETETSYARALNIFPGTETLTLGHVFSDQAVEIEGLTAIAVGSVSAGETGSLVPAESSWRLLTALDGEELGTGCFYALGTEPGYRGYLVVGDDIVYNLDVSQWPPTVEREYMLCF